MKYIAMMLLAGVLSLAGNVHAAATEQVCRDKRAELAVINTKLNTAILLLDGYIADVRSGKLTDAQGRKIATDMANALRPEIDKGTILYDFITKECPVKPTGMTL